MASKLFKVAKNHQKLLKHPRSSKKKIKMKKGPMLAKSGQKKALKWTKVAEKKGQSVQKQQEAAKGQK